MSRRFRICSRCGNVAAVIRDTGTPLCCCGEKMHEVMPRKGDVSGEKHTPVYRVNGNMVHVTVGSVEHPMNEEHYIEWICLETARSVQYAHLNPGDEPRAEFAICEKDEIEAVYAFCNQHSLWRN